MKTTTDNSANPSIKTYLSALALGLAAGLSAGCTDDDTNSTPQISETAEAMTISAPETRSFRGHKRDRKHSPRDGQGPAEGMRHHDRGKRGHKKEVGGILFKAALDQETLTDAQRSTIEALIEENRAKKEWKPRDGFKADLAAAVRKGKLDTEAMKAKWDAMNTERTARAEARANRLATLHATLDKSQRQSVVESINARAEKRAEKPRHMEHGNKHGRSMKHGDNGIFRLVYGLDLTAEQKKEIDALHQNLLTAKPRTERRDADREAAKTCRAQFIESFAADNFDPASRPCLRNDTAAGEDRIAEHAQSFAGLMAILTEDQREQLAEDLEKGDAPKHRPNRPSRRM